MTDEKLDIEDVEEEVTEAPAAKATIVAFNGATRMDFKQTLAWLEAETDRAGLKMRDGEGGHNMQGCRMQYEACQKLHDQIKPWGAGNASKPDRDKLAGLLKKPMNLMVELAEIKSSIA